MSAVLIWFQHGTAAVGAPGQPGTPVITVRGDTQLTVEWDPPVDPSIDPVTDHVIEVTPAPATGTAKRNTGSALGRYVFTGLTNGVQYRFTVRAINAKGEGALSQPSTAKSPREAFVKLDVTALLNEAGQPELRFPSTPHQVAVYRDGALVEIADPVPVTTGVQGYVDDDFLYDDLWTYTVAPYSEGEYGPLSDPDTVRTAGNPLPPPANVSAYFGQQVITDVVGVHLEWDKTLHDKVRIYRDGERIFEGQGQFGFDEVTVIQREQANGADGLLEGRRLTSPDDKVWQTAGDFGTAPPEKKGRIAVVSNRIGMRPGPFATVGATTVQEAAYSNVTAEHAIGLTVTALPTANNNTYLGAIVRGQYLDDGTFGNFKFVGVGLSFAGNGMSGGVERARWYMLLAASNGSMSASIANSALSGTRRSLETPDSANVPAVGQKVIARWNPVDLIMEIKEINGTVVARFAPSFTYDWPVGNFVGFVSAGDVASPMTLDDAKWFLGGKPNSNRRIYSDTSNDSYAVRTYEISAFDGKTESERVSFTVEVKLPPITKTDTDSAVATDGTAAFGQRSIGKLPPDAIVASTGVVGPVTHVQDDPAGPDSNYLVGTGEAMVRVSFPSPGGELQRGPRFQRFRVRTKVTA